MDWTTDRNCVQAKVSSKLNPNLEAVLNNNTARVCGRRRAKRETQERPQTTRATRGFLHLQPDGGFVAGGAPVQHRSDVGGPIVSLKARQS